MAWDGRSRFVFNNWIRDPQGPILKRPPPCGKRTPNKLIWGETLDDFFWIQRIPNKNVLTIWSRSMIEEFGENFLHEENEHEGTPRVRRAWPVLRIEGEQERDVYEEFEEDVECFGSEFVYRGFGKAGPVLEDEEELEGEEEEKGKGKEEEAHVAEGSESKTIAADENAGQSGAAPTPDAAAGSKSAEKAEDHADSNPKTEVTSGVEPSTADAPALVPPTDVTVEEGPPSGDVPMDDADSETKKTEDMRATGDGDGDIEPAQETVSDIPPPEAGAASPMKLDNDSPSPKDADGSPSESKAPSNAGSEISEDNAPAPEVVPAADGKAHVDTDTFAKLPKLEEFIPEAYFPDVLLVTDHRDLTSGTAFSSRDETPLTQTAPKRYKRVFPQFDRDDLKPAKGAEPRTAHLHLSPAAVMGSGHHSYVYRAPLTLPAPLRANSATGQVTVAAKVAMPGTEARELLANEARTYKSMPRHMMEEWSGLNLVSPIKYPVPVGPVAPKFFGWYEPEKDEVAADEAKRTRHGLSGILLLEECGEPIDPSEFTLDQLTECYSLFIRLHYANILQGSVYTRNILWQPGPLWRAPAQRSLDTPSFRVIDYGRAVVEADWIADGERELRQKGGKGREGMTDAQWAAWRQKRLNALTMQKSQAESQARRELNVEGFNY